jgi:hypothetical protein
LLESNQNGIVVAEAPGADHAIARLPTSACAFVGRTLRGPVNRPVAVRSFAEFQQVFGGLWQPSPMPYAVEQFFDNGGRRAVIVRVCNGAAPATITLPCGQGSLTLEARCPGTRESLRASVDYDNIGANEDDRFNLVLQRVRAAGSEHIEDQEIFRRLSVMPGSTRYVVTALQESTLVRVRGAVPDLRPDRTLHPDGRQAIGYVDSNPDGDDGEPLTDYDLIGSPARRSGLFALRTADDVSFLNLPPPARDRDLGPGVLVVASRVCRELGAMLIVDPPSAWTSCDAAIRGLHELDLQSDQALMAFPRILAYDRLRGRYETFANGGAVAGVLARQDEMRSPWQPGPDDELLLRAGTRPAITLADGERARLTAHGINPLQCLRTADEHRLPLRTLAGGAGRNADASLLTLRRRALLVIGSIERGTRWAVFEAGDRSVWHKLTRQVQDFLQPLAADGLFGAGDPRDACRVVCDERVNSPADVREGRVNLLVSLRSTRSDESLSFLVTHSVDGSRVRAVRSNSLPPGALMSVHASRGASRLEATPRPKTLAQELFGYRVEPRPERSGAAASRLAEPATPWRRDRDAISGLDGDLDGPGQPL